LSEAERAVVSEYHLQEQSADIPMPELLKAKSILAVLNECKIEKIDVVAHSEGAINSIISALLSPEKFRNIIIVGSAGITDKGEDNALHRTIGFARTTMQDVRKFFKNPDSREALLRASNESTKYVAGNPAAAVDEVGAIASFNIEEMIEKLHEKGIKISLVHGTDDTMFPMDEMQTKKLVENEAIYEFFPMKGHYHHDIYMPEEAAFIETVLESMEKKEKME
jgi:pimeloyl-ACP methyl ester carboxylesterase